MIPRSDAPIARPRRAIPILGVLCAGSMLAGGCFAPPVAVLSAGFGVAEATPGLLKRGEVRIASEYNFGEVRQAVRDALPPLGFRIDRENQTSDDTWFLAAYDDLGTATTFRVYRRTERVTVLRIRTGTFGDRAVTGLILKHIAARLTGRDPYEGHPFSSVD